MESSLAVIWSPLIHPALGQGVYMGIGHPQQRHPFLAGMREMLGKFTHIVMQMLHPAKPDIWQVQGSTTPIVMLISQLGGAAIPCAPFTQVTIDYVW